MSELNNIDKLLKESFSEFAPDAPNVWQGIEQGVQAAQAGQAAGVAGAVKGGMGIVAKIVAAVAVSASLVTGYILLSDKEQAPVTEATPQTTVSEIQPQVAIEEPQEVAPIVDETVVTPSSAQTKTAKPESFPAPKSMEQSNAQSPVAAAAEAVSKTEPVSDPQKRDELPATTNVPVAVTASVNSNTNKAATEPVKTVGSTTSEPTGKHTDQPVKKESEKPAVVDNELTEIYDEPVIPGSFSPNGDGINDRYIIMIERESLYSLVIQDLKGNIVFESDNKSNTWDGKDSRTGILCAPGSFFYTFKYQFKGSQQPHKKSGMIRLF